MHRVENFNKHIMPHNHQAVEKIEYFHLLQLSLTLFLITSPAYKGGGVFAYLFVHLFMFIELGIQPGTSCI